ncbi:uncharacterized protein M8220_005299 isoform 3-T21 [Acridotheres tristis]
MCTATYNCVTLKPRVWNYGVRWNQWKYLNGITGEKEAQPGTRHRGWKSKTALKQLDRQLDTDPTLEKGLIAVGTSGIEELDGCFHPKTMREPHLSLDIEPLNRHTGAISEHHHAGFWKHIENSRKCSKSKSIVLSV